METLTEKVKRFLALDHGSGDGSGYGYGSGDGSGDGDGYGYGNGSGSGVINFNGFPAYWIDNEPTLIYSASSVKFV